MTRFLHEPPSVRGATGVIVTATAVVVAGGGVAMRLLDHAEYSNVWVGMWWALQTVTTVGYGDVTPEHVSGRIVGSFVMLYGIAFLTITIAAITSTFVTRAERELAAELHAAEEEDERLERRFEDVSARLERVEQLLKQLTGRAEQNRAMEASGTGGLTVEQRKVTLDQRIHTEEAQGWRVESRTDTRATLASGKPLNTKLHLILTICTVGIWGIVWFGLWITGGEKHRTLTVDEYGSVVDSLV